MVVLATMLFLGFLFLVRPSFIGYIVYTPSNYIYNTSLINMSDNEIKLIPVVTTSITSTQSISQVTGASYDNENKLDKVNSLNNGDVNVNPNKNLSLTLSSNFQDNDIISIYVKHNKQTDINLCDSNEGCSRTYATNNYNGNPSWLNFTISNSNSKNNFNLVTIQDNAKIDYVYGTHFTTITNTTTSYPSSGSIETQDIQPTNISRFDYVNYTNILNNQRIDYFYSLDSGNIWSNLSNKNVSSLNTTSIKIKAILTSDGTITPIIDSISMFYSEIIQETQNTTNSTENNQSNSFNQSTNSLPNNPNPVILPNPAYENSSLNVSSIIIDPNADLMTVEIVFWNNTKEHFRVNKTNIENNSYVSYSLLNNATNNFTVNETWVIGFKVFDGNISSDWVNASIQINSLNNSQVTENNQSQQNNSSNGNQTTESSPSSSSSSSSSGGGTRTPSQVPKTETKKIEIIPKRQEQKEIKLFERPKIQQEPEKTQPQEKITTQAVKEVSSKGIISIYAFVALVIISYFVYHYKVKKMGSKSFSLKKSLLKKTSGKKQREGSSQKNKLEKRKLNY